VAAKQVEAPRLLMSAGEIQAAYKWSRDQFVMFVALGLPARKINGRWYAYSSNIDKFLRSLLKSGKPLMVDTARLPEEIMEG
jgi:hypothetical protein